MIKSCCCWHHTCTRLEKITPHKRFPSVRKQVTRASSITHKKNAEPEVGMVGVRRCECFIRCPGQQGVRAHSTSSPVNVFGRCRPRRFRMPPSASSGCGYTHSSSSVRISSLATSAHCQSVISTTRRAGGRMMPRTRACYLVNGHSPTRTSASPWLRLGLGVSVCG